MADKFSLSGGYSSVPFTPAQSADFSVESTLDEQVAISDKLAATVDLNADGPQAVPMGSIALAAIVIIKVVTGLKIDAIITTSDGVSQIVPVDSLLVLISQGVPVTALSLTRTPATQTSVRVFLGQKA